MKKMIAVILTVLLAVTVLTACQQAPQPAASASASEAPASASAEPTKEAQPSATQEAQSSAQIANPWTQAKDAAEVKTLTGIEMSALPEGATGVSYSVLEKEKLAQAVFTWNGDEYTFRMAPDDAVEDMSGMYVDFKAEEDVTFGKYHYDIEYNEGAEGESTWEIEPTNMDYSVTMSTGANREKLIAVSEALIPAG